MTNDDYVQKLDELDRLLNDPGVPMQPILIWRMLDEISTHAAGTVRSRFAAFGHDTDRRVDDERLISAAQNADPPGQAARERTQVNSAPTPRGRQRSM